MNVKINDKNHHERVKISKFSTFILTEDKDEKQKKRVGENS